MEMFTSAPRLCNLHIYFLVPGTAGNKSAARCTRRHGGSESGGPALAFAHSSNQTPREVFQSLQEPRSFPRLMLFFTPLSTALRSENFKGEKQNKKTTSSALAAEGKRLETLRIFISRGTCSPQSLGGSDRLGISVWPFPC